MFHSGELLNCFIIHTTLTYCISKLSYAYDEQSTSDIVFLMTSSRSISCDKSTYKTALLSQYCSKPLRTMRFFLFCSLLTLTLAQGGQENVALIIGGANVASQELLSSVELFGCPNEESILVPGELPQPLYLSGSIYLPDRDVVLICGGFAIDDEELLYGITTDCFTYNPRDGFNDAPHLVGEESAHLLALGPNLDNDPADLTAILISASTQIFESYIDNWAFYKKLDTRRWSTLQCLLQDGDNVYFVDNMLHVLDLTTWEISSFGIRPQVDNVGKCALTEIKGVKGTSVLYSILHI